MAVPFRMPVDDNIKHLIKTVIMILIQTRMEVSDDTTGLLDCMNDLHVLLSSEYERRNRNSQKDFHLRDSLILLKCKLEEQFPNSRRSYLEEGPEASLCDDCKSAKIVTDEIDNQWEQRLHHHHHHHHHHDQVPDREQFLQANSYRQENTRRNEKTDDSAWWLPMSLRRSLWSYIPVLCVLGWHYLETSLA